MKWGGIAFTVTLLQVVVALFPLTDASPHIRLALVNCSLFVIDCICTQVADGR